MLSLWNSTQRFFCGENLPIDHLFLFSKKNVDAFLIPLQLTQPTKIMWGIKGLFLMGDLVKLEFLPSPMLLMVMGCRSWADSISTALFSLVFSENLRNFRTVLLLLSVNLLLIFPPPILSVPFFRWDWKACNTFSKTLNDDVGKRLWWPVFPKAGVFMTFDLHASGWDFFPLYYVIQYYFFALSLF